MGTEADVSIRCGVLRHWHVSYLVLFRFCLEPMAGSRRNESSSVLPSVLLVTDITASGAGLLVAASGFGIVLEGYSIDSGTREEQKNRIEIKQRSIYRTWSKAVEFATLHRAPGRVKRDDASAAKTNIDLARHHTSPPPRPCLPLSTPASWFLSHSPH